MGSIPIDARWYLADIVLEHSVEGDPRNVVHINTHLVEAESADEAYEKSFDLGRASELEYANTEGRLVRVMFRGLRELDVIHDSLEDGAELSYRESVGVPEERLRDWVISRQQLGVFAPRQSKRDVPNIMPESVMRMLEAEGFDRGEFEEPA